MLIAIITFLKFWLTFCDKTNYFHRSRPSMLYYCTILNLYHKPF